MTESEEWDAHVPHDVEDFTFRTSQLATILSDVRGLVDASVLGSPDFDRIFDASPTALQLVAADGSFRRVNPAFAAFLGRDMAEVLELTMRDVVHELDQDDGDPLLGRHPTAGEAAAQHLCRYVRRDGEVVWAWLVMSEPVDGLDDVPVRLGQIVDVTSQLDVIGRSIAARQEIADRKAWYRSLVLPGADPVMRIRGDGIVVKANDAAMELFAFDPTSAHHLDELVSPAASTRLRSMIAAAVAEGSSHSLEPHHLRIGGGDDKRWFVIRVVPDLGPEAGGTVHLVFGDVTGGVESERRLTELALTDPLTGIANRAAVQDRLDHSMKRLRRQSDSGVAVVAIDIDNFKALNDVYGHAFGDTVLVQFAHAANGVIRELDTIGRLGGDEFLVILEDTASLAHARQAAERLAIALNPFVSDVEGMPPVEVSTSLGMAWTSEPVDASWLIAAADERLMLAKRSGRGRLWLPDDLEADVAVNTGKVSRRDLILELRRAIDDHEFVLQYQPLVDRDDELFAVEALVRWQHPDRGLLPPDTFVPLLIETGQIATVGTWVMETSIAQVAKWRNESGSSVRININASAGEIARPEYRRALMATLDREGVEPGAVNVELTEQALAGGAVSQMAMHELTESGVNLVLDDFGTGISSLAHLRTMSLSGVKIDRTFVSDTRHGDIDRRIVRGVTQLAHEVGVEVTAEGVETEEQSDWIRSIGCDYLQGYFFGRPAWSEEIAELAMGRQPIAEFEASRASR